MTSYGHTQHPEMEMIGSVLVQSAFKVHFESGPGLPERIYKTYLEYEIKKAGLYCQRELIIPGY